MASASATAPNGFSLVEPEKPPTVNGYRHCGLHALAACENSNQLFWGESDRLGNSPAKHEIRDALGRFLKGAPTPYWGVSLPPEVQTNAASDIGDGLVGPGPSVGLASGEWFFSGFTPHAAMVQAAALFDAHGNILAVALLDGVWQANGGDTFSLYVYSHGALSADRFAHFRTWAQQVASESRSGDVAPSRFDGPIAVEFDSKDWIVRRLS